MRTLQISIITFILLFIGCQKPIPQKGIWSGSITIAENKKLPFQMSLDLNTDSSCGYFINGNEITQIPEIELQNDSLTFIFSEYRAAMRGIWDGKEWRGKFYRFRTDTTWNEFTASPMLRQKVKDTTDIRGVSLAGKFHTYIKTPKGIDSSNIANFWMKNDSIYGTLIAPDGDYGLLVGIQRGNKVTLARFTGWQAYLMELELNGESWNGRLISRIGNPMEFILTPQRKIYTRLNPERITTMIAPKAQFTFFGTTSTGEIISSADEKFKNKVLLIDIMGTWCHNCIDAAPLLQQLYLEYQKEGLEVIGLSFEISDNIEIAKKNLSLFQKRYGITYNVLFCGNTKEENVRQKLHAQLKNFYGYPTTLFVDRKGIVKEIHVGFKGPGSGEIYQEQIQQYYEIIRKLLK